MLKIFYFTRFVIQKKDYQNCTNRTNFVLNLARTSVLPLRSVRMQFVLSTVVPVRVLYYVLEFS